GWDGEPAEEPDRETGSEEEDADRQWLRDTPRLEPLDPRPDRRGEGQGEEQQDDDVPHLPDAERRRGHRDHARRRRRARARQVPGLRFHGLLEVGVHHAGAGSPSCGATRPAEVRASATRRPKTKPPTWAKNAVPPPFAFAPNSPAFASNSWY